MAKITRQKVDLSDEKNLVTGAILSTTFLDHLRPLLNDLSLLKEPSNRTILSWCLDYYDNYKEAPGSTIQDIFISERRRIPNEETHESIKTVLDHLNERYLEDPALYNDHYYITKSKDYIEQRAMETLAETIKGHLATGNLADARKALTGFNKVDKVLTTGIDLWRSDELVNDIFDNAQESLFDTPFDDLNEMLQDMYRGDVVAVAGPAKRGKSYLMNQLGYWAAQSGLNVGFFSFEMEARVMGIRAFQNFMGETKKEMKEPKEVGVFDENDDLQFIEFQKEGLSKEKVNKFRKKFRRYNKVGAMRLYDAKSCGRKISDIVATCERVEKYDGIKFDVIVVDYDALLENEYGFQGSHREANTQIWKDLKAKLAQDLDMLTITGSQYGRDAINGDAGVENTAENIRKFDFASHWITINQNKKEKSLGLMRLDVVGRHDEFNSINKVVCTQALGLGRPIVDARWLKKVSNYDSIVGKQDDTEEDEDIDHKNKKMRRRRN